MKASLWITGWSTEVTIYSKLIDGYIDIGGGYYEGEATDGVPHGIGTWTSYDGKQ